MGIEFTGEEKGWVLSDALHSSGCIKEYLTDAKILEKARIVSKDISRNNNESTAHEIGFIEGAKWARDYITNKK